MMNKMWRSEFCSNCSMHSYTTYTCCVIHMTAVSTMDLMRMTFLTMYSGWILSTLMERGERKERERSERYSIHERFNSSFIRYFTWDAAKFPNSVEMQNKLAAKGRKMVTIIDPHIKRDGNYHIHKVCTVHYCIIP